MKNYKVKATGYNMCDLMFIERVNVIKISFHHQVIQPF